MGTFVGALGALSLIAITLTPLLLTGAGGDPDAYPVAETSVMTMLIIVWAGYALGVAAQGWFDLDERAIGFYAAVAATASVVALLYFAITLFLPFLFLPLSYTIRTGWADLLLHGHPVQRPTARGRMGRTVRFDGGCRYRSGHRFPGNRDQLNGSVGDYYPVAGEASHLYLVSVRCDRTLASRLVA
jgi:hypothetical protein